MIIPAEYTGVLNGSFWNTLTQKRGILITRPLNETKLGTEKDYSAKKKIKLTYLYLKLYHVKRAELNKIIVRNKNKQIYPSKLLIFLEENPIKNEVL